MLEAKQISNSYGSYQYQEPILTPKSKINAQSRPKKISSFFAKLVVVSVVLLAVLTGLLITATHAQITSKTDHIILLKKEISDLDNANERLRLEIARLKSLERVELIAVKELGMIQPGMQDIKYIAFSENEALDGIIEDSEGTEGKKIVKTITNENIHPAVIAINKLVFNHVSLKNTPKE